MKKGADALEEHNEKENSDDSSHEVNQADLTLEELLDELAADNAIPFKEWANPLDHINLSEMLIESDCTPEQIGTALEGTLVRSIDISENELGAVAAISFIQALKKTSVTKVHMYANGIGPEGCVEIASLLKYTGVTSIDLSYNTIKESAAKLVEALEGSKVEKINLSATYISDECALGIAKAAKKTLLRKISLLISQITAQGAVKFIEALNGSLVNKLDLNIDNTNPLSASDIHDVVEAIRNSSLTHVKLSLGCMNDDDIIAFVNAAPKGKPIKQHILLADAFLSGNIAILEAIAKSCFLHLEFWYESSALVKVLNENQKKFVLPSYYMVAASHLPEDAKQKHLNYKPKDEDNYATGIVVNLSKDLRRQVMGYLPLMTRRFHGDQVPRLVEACQRYHRDGVKIGNDESDLIKKDVKRRKVNK